MKLPLLLCVCFSLISLPAWADKPYKQHPQSNEQPYPEQGKFQKKKDRPQASEEQRAEGMYMLGQVATLRADVTDIEILHHEVTTDAVCPFRKPL